MATKTKTSETQAAAPDLSLENAFAAGLKLIDAKRWEDAKAAFEAVHASACARELLNMSHAARGYLRAVQARIDEKTVAKPDSLELSAQLDLNHGHSTEALATLDKALAAQPERATLHYLKALAHAQLEQAQESADALAAAAGFDGDVLFQFHLESDFDGVRFTAPFAALHRA